MSDIYNYAVSQVNQSQEAFIRFITANDVNLTSHQNGFYVPHVAESLLFDSPGIKGENKDRFVTIRWQNDFETFSRFIYYGKKSRNEYRITRFGRGFPFLSEDYVGSLLIICKLSEEYYSGIVLEHDEDIDEFYAEFNLPADRTNHYLNFISTPRITPDDRLRQELERLASGMVEFPGTRDLSNMASEAYDSIFDISPDDILKDPDTMIRKWIGTESDLFYLFEDHYYRPVYTTPFRSIGEFAEAANSFLNRRKSRFGKSLEHHLSRVFTKSQIRFTEQEVTEGNKKPDFLFPGIQEYRDDLFPTDDLTFLGAKTTCKDRWRQVINEARRIETKYLFTLQPSISANQLKEMQEEHVVLVIPEDNRNTFDARFRDGLLSLKQFVNMVQVKQEHHKELFLI